MATRSLGQITYEGYGEASDWFDEDGRLMLSWESLGVEQQTAWQAAGKAVAKHVTAANQKEGA